MQMELLKVLLYHSPLFYGTFQIEVSFRITLPGTGRCPLNTSNHFRLPTMLPSL